MSTRASVMARAAERVAARAAQSGLRRLETVMTSSPGRIVIECRELLNFASNDYLGLSGHAAIRAALIDCVARDGVGATAAHLLGGHRAPHAALERDIAEWLGRPAALLFSTGYHANLGIIGALVGDGDLCVQDKLNHASLIDGAALAGCALRRYPHGDVAAAERQLTSASNAPALLATDGVFSMDGAIAPLRELADLCARQRATLLVDDAHAIGVVGTAGRGSVAAANLTVDDAPIVMATMGKALGTFGAFVSGSEALIEALVQFARSFVFTTAIPPALAAASSAAIRVTRHEHWRRDKLAMLVRHFRRGAEQRGIALLPSQTPIQPVVVGEGSAALALSKHLRERGFYVPAVRPPTVPAGAARLRVTLSAAHDEREVSCLLDAIEQGAA